MLDINRLLTLPSFCIHWAHDGALRFQTFPALDPDDTVYEPRSSRLLVRGLGENDVDDDEEDCESSARLLGMSFMNRSATQRSSASPYVRQPPPR